jgi:hypothetical protein
MMDAGHSEQFRDVITTRAVARYTTAMTNHLRQERGEEGGRWMYRTRQERERQWREKGGRSTKADWFRKGGATSVLNVPATEGSVLAARATEVLQQYTSPASLRPRVQERPGPSVLSVLKRTNPFPKDTCGRALCPWLARGENCAHRCYRESLCYVAFCRQCRVQPAEQGSDTGGGREEESNITEQAYIGETSRSVVTRIRSHVADYRQTLAKLRARGGGRARRVGASQHGEEEQETSSWMADHVMERHNGDHSDDPNNDFEFHTVRSFSKVLDRQVAEALTIEIAQKTGVIEMGPVLQKVAKELSNRKNEITRFNPRGWRPVRGFQPRTPG